MFENLRSNTHSYVRFYLKTSAAFHQTKSPTFQTVFIFGTRFTSQPRFIQFEINAADKSPARPHNFPPLERCQSSFENVESTMDPTLAFVRIEYSYVR